VTSAVANAEQKGVSDLDRLFIKEITVDQGPVLKRFLPRAQGRATKIRKPTSHILVVLAEK
jgi:large subunit ribosomal protein L22